MFQRLSKETSSAEWTTTYVREDITSVRSVVRSQEQRTGLDIKKFMKHYHEFL
jgi:hypothetical protein